MANETEKQKILLESGTNELEIVEFNLADATYGINIAKVCEIIKADITIVSVPDSHPSIDGAINLRGRIIPIINLAKHLNADVVHDAKNNRIIISEFNQIVVGFWVSSVSQIHRLSWKQVEQPSDLLQTKEGYAVGVVKINERILFLLDFEKIAAHINPRVGISSDPSRVRSHARSAVERSQKTILVAEDSDFIRGLLVDNLTQAGYRTAIAKNGEEAWGQIAASLERPDFKTISDTFNLMITDIEMPQMDGLHLIKRVKENPKLRKLPCIAFSSMITPQLAIKCKDVGSDGEIAKPDIDKLIDLVDEKSL